MAISKLRGRQYPLTAVSDRILYSDLTSGAASVIVELPGNAIVTGGQVLVLTAFDSATSDVLDVGDSDDPNRFTASQIDLTATGSAELTVGTANALYSVPTDVEVVWTGTGAAPSAGEFLVILEYVIEGRGNETQ